MLRRPGQFNEVQKFLLLTSHIITPRMIIVNEAFCRVLHPADRDLLQVAVAACAARQDRALQAQEPTLAGLLRAERMTSIEPDVAHWRGPVRGRVPRKFDSKCRPRARATRCRRRLKASAGSVWGAIRCARG